ncbi:MFS transporter [Actinomadura atramentaria]|uniref:MFS transporter n=1 Tax=Actinomadura atramentaria TaxID=1990 RepID=UPI00037B71C8|nr:MFS transporter [Actinomadura atramentaria]
MERKWWTLTAVVVGVFMLLLDVTIVNVALPDIEQDFSSSLSDLQWVIDAYALTLAAGLLTAGSLADLLGRRALYAAGTGIFTLGSLLCGLANGPLFLSIARAGQGIGGAIMFATSLALLGHAFRGKDRGVAFGVYGAVSGLGVAVGPVLGGLLTSGIDWRWIFFVNIPVGVAAIIVTLTKLEESKDPHASRPDWLGFVTFSGGLALLTYGLIEAGDGWGQNRVVWSLAGGAVLLAAFLVVELLQRRPMLDLSLLRKPTFSGGLIAAFALSASIFSLFTFLVLYMQGQLHYSAVQTGTRFLTLTAAMFVASTAAGRLSHTVPVRAMIGVGFLLVGGGLFLMRGIETGSSWTHLIPGMIIAGAGSGMVTVPLASTAVGVVPVTRAGMASGINSTFRQVGIVTGIAVLGTLYTSKLRDTVVDKLAGTRLADRAQSIADGMGGSSGAAGAAHGKGDPLIAAAARAGAIDGLNSILLVGAVIALVAAVASFALIRKKDFVPPPGRPPQGAPNGAAATVPDGTVNGGSPNGVPDHGARTAERP